MGLLYGDGNKVLCFHKLPIIVHLAGALFAFFGD